MGVGVGVHACVSLYVWLHVCVCVHTCLCMGVCVGESLGVGMYIWVCGVVTLWLCETCFQKLPAI